MAKRIVMIRHDNEPPDDRAYTWALRNGFEPQVLKPFAGMSIGEADGRVAGTVIHGGPFNVYETDRQPFLAEDYRWIGKCLANDIPVLGTCQGARQIAWHLGAFAGAAEHGLAEFGYYDVTPTDEGHDVLPETLALCQAHFHTFGIPEGGTHLAGSGVFPNRTFRYGSKVFGFQFHAEVTIEGFRRWQSDHKAQYERPGAQTRTEQDQLMLAHDGEMAKWFYGFLDRFFLKDAWA